MISLFVLFIFFFGLIVGSFLNCVIFRLEKEESFLRGRSYCPHCKNTLAWQDLIPILSFLFLKGKCRYCRKPISWQYPLVELATGIIFVLIYVLQFSASFQLIALLYLLITFSLLIIIFIFDLKSYIIPDSVVYSAIVISFIYNLSINNLKLAFLSAILAAGFFLAIVLISRGKWMGVGDIKLAFFMVLFLGWPNILTALFLSFFLGAIIGIMLMALKKKGLKSEIPFGPFLITGTFIAFFWGGRIIEWYLNIVSVKIL
jgi:prepilin signal peptidase PulO-like enzyme (type II secretory pathway)